MSRCAHVNIKWSALLAFKSFPSTLVETRSYYHCCTCLDLQCLPAGVQSLGYCTQPEVGSGDEKSSSHSYPACTFLIEPSTCFMALSL